MTIHIDGTTVALIGGTGKEGRGLAFRWCKAGYQVFVGSRSEERATSTANELGQLVPGSRVYGVSNVEAAEKSANIVLTVPYSGQTEVRVEREIGLARPARAIISTVRSARVTSRTR